MQRITFLLPAIGLMIAATSVASHAQSCPGSGSCNIATPTTQISVSTNGGGPSGSNWVYTFNTSDGTPGVQIHYTINACGQTAYYATASPGVFTYSCTGSNGATAAIYAYVPNASPACQSTTIYPNF